MSLTNMTRTRILEPRTFTQQRCEIRFDSGSCFLSNIKLGNVGYYRDTAGAGNINTLAGQYECIKRIVLMDGNMTLAQINNFDRYATIMNLSHTNADNKSRDKILSKANVGFSVTGVNTNGVVEKVSLSGNAQQYADVVDVETAWLYLPSVLPMLQSTQYLSTSMFDNLRLVVEFKPKAGYLINRPLVFCDEVIDEEARAKINSSVAPFEYVEIESDFFVVPEQTVSAANEIVRQVVKPALKGFNNKYVEKLTLMKTPVSVLPDDTDGYCSSQQYKEVVNVNIGGEPIYENGYDRPNKSLARSTDFHGVMNIPYGDIGSGEILANQNCLSTSLSHLRGSLDYKVMSIKSPVKTLEFRYERSALYDTGAAATDKAYSQQLNCYVFGEVLKVFQPNGGKYVLSYA
jgi:hypothetical protein